jgi:hypothetical protein
MQCFLIDILISHLSTNHHCIWVWFWARIAMPIEERPCLIDKGRIKLRSLGIFRLVPGRQFSRRFNKPSLCYHAAVQLSWSTFSNCKYAPNISYMYCGAIHKYFAGVHVPNAPRSFPHFNESKHGKRIILAEINQWQSIYAHGIIYIQIT